ncbi:hypothetical protein [Fibrella aquatica]|uniref:hypothetical protein n=1 Tax=Fibrella aquatica TaxID=3242487 RepID=UPI00352180D8
MKTLLFSFCATLVSAACSWAQVATSTLNNDLSFRQALTSVQYPLLVEPSTKEAKVYVNFTITKAGKIDEVKLLKMGSFSNAFVGEVNRIIADLPLQKSNYAGEYVLPVVFEAKIKSGDYQPTASDRAAFDKTFIQLRRQKTVLDELYVFAK